MAPDASMDKLLTQLSMTLNSAGTSLPEEGATLPPQSGISLLDVKNELFVSYLQNLVFLVLLKLRDHIPNGNGIDEYQSSSATDVHDDVIKKLAELRVYLERGVKPLEGKLKYQLDKVIRAAAAKATSGRSAEDEAPSKRRANGQLHAEHADDYSSDSNGSSAASEAKDRDFDELSYRPNPSDFTRPSVASAGTRKFNKSETNTAVKDSGGIYRPPRINPTAPPTFDDRRRGSSLRDNKVPRSGTLDEFVDTELSTGPAAQPSVGSTVVSGGRRSKSARELAMETERTAYEEENFVRLPGDSKKERAMKRKREQMGGMFGGEDLKGLGEGLDRIGRLTGRRKPGRVTEDGPRGNGHQGGHQKRRRGL